MFRKIAVVIALFAFQAFPFSFASFPPIIGKGDFAVSPFIFMDDNNHGAMETFFYYGASEKADISFSLFNGYGTADFSLMPRYQIGPVMASVRANESWADPQVSYFWNNEKAFLQATGVSHITYDYSTKPAFYGIVGPGIFLSWGIELSCDLTAGYYQQNGDCGGLRSKGLGLDVGPCVSSPLGKGYMVLSLPIYNVNRDALVTFGLGFFFPVGTK